MNSVIIKIKFNTPVHFGKRRLVDSEMTLHSDTLFSALFIEALSLEIDTDFLLNDLIITDTFPFVDEIYYLPKPLISVENKHVDDDYKVFKKLKYIPHDQYFDYVKGNIDSHTATELIENFKFGQNTVQTKVSLVNIDEKGDGDSDPYSVGTYTFTDNAGLYFIARGSDESLEQLAVLMDSLQYSGLGGKRFSGLGRFTYEINENIPMFDYEDDQVNEYILLSTSMATYEELQTINAEHSRFTLVKRSGFVQSDNFEQQLVKKRDFYSFNAGSVFISPFKGMIFEVGENGKHPVYRYAKSFWLGVK